MESNNKSSVLLTVLGVCTLLVALVGASFAYFSATATTGEESIQTGKLEIQSTLSESEENNIKPTTFSAEDADENNDVAKLTFNVKGVGTTVTGGTYKIELLGTLAGNKTVSEKGETSEIKYALYKQGETTEAISQGSFDDIKSKKTIDDPSFTLDSSTDNNYTLYVYIEETSENQDNLQNVTVSVAMNATAQTPAPAGV